MDSVNPCNILDTIEKATLRNNFLSRNCYLLCMYLHLEYQTGNLAIQRNDQDAEHKEFRV